MFRIIRNLSWQRSLGAVVLVGGGLLGIGALPAQAQSVNYRAPQQFVRPATQYATQPNLSTSAARINANLQTGYNHQHMPGWDWWRTYPYSTYNTYNPYNPYSPYYGYNYGSYPYYPYYGYGYGYYGGYPNVVYPYVSPYGTP